LVVDTTAVDDPIVVSPETAGVPMDAVDPEELDVVELPEVDPDEVVLVWILARSRIRLCRKRDAACSCDTTVSGLT
jgi:hypothetical protein